MGTAQAAGVAILAAARLGIPVALHTPSEVKAAVTGSGRAGKEQVAAMVTRILRLPAAPTPGGRLGRARPRDLPPVARRHGGGGRTARAGVVTPAQRRWVEAARERPAARRAAPGRAAGAR